MASVEVWEPVMQGVGDAALRGQQDLSLPDSFTDGYDGGLAGGFEDDYFDDDLSEIEEFEEEYFEEDVEALPVPDLSKFQKQETAPTAEEEQMEMVKTKLEYVTEAGIDCMVMLCPLCYIQYELGQIKLKKVKNYNMPVFYYPELLALAVGIPASELAFDQHRVKTKGILTKLGFNGGKK